MNFNILKYIDILFVNFIQIFYHKKSRGQKARIEIENYIIEIITIIQTSCENFVFTEWNSAEDAVNYFEKLLKKVRMNIPGTKVELEYVFAPTNSLQDLSIDNGWGDRFLKIASKIDILSKYVN